MIREELISIRNASPASGNPSLRCHLFPIRSSLPELLRLRIRSSIPIQGFAFPENRIPASRMSPQGLALARLYPAPNVFDGTVQNYRAVGKLETAADAFGFRFDHRISSNNEAFLEYQFNRDTTDDPFNLLGGITNLPSFGVHDALQTHTLRLNNTHVFSPAVIHQLRFSAGYLKQPRTIPGDQTALPAILMTSFSHLGHATNLPQERRNRSFELLNDVHGSTPRRRRNSVELSVIFHSTLRSICRPRAVSPPVEFLLECARELVARAAHKCPPPDRKHDARFST
jgi:hypothetical protein